MTDIVFIGQPKQDIPDLIAGALGVSRGTAYDLMREALAEQPAQQEPVTDEENEKFSRDVSNFKGADPEATKHALEEFLRNRVPAIGDIRAAGAIRARRTHEDRN